MQYKFRLTYKPTDGGAEVTREGVKPIYGDDLTVVIARESGEWYYKRTLDGKLTFKGADYAWIRAQAFDGTFTLTIENSVDGTLWNAYFEGSFSVASMTWDLDNKECVLDGLSEGAYSALENGKDVKYDLRKLIPDTEAKEVQGEIWPALAMVDYRSASISSSDVYCNGASTAGGYKSGDSGYTEKVDVRTNTAWRLMGVYAEAKITVADGQSEELKGSYCGKLQYGLITEAGLTITSIKGSYDQSYLANENDCRITFQVGLISPSNYIYVNMRVWDSEGNYVTGATANISENTTEFYSPNSIVFTDFGPNPILEQVELTFHYIRATLLTVMPSFTFLGSRTNVLDTSTYYKFMRAFEGSGLTIMQSLRTSEQSNGHRLVPGTDVYFAPPDDTGDWIPLAEDNWNYASLWYRITPSVANGLTNPAYIAPVRWGLCWTVGCCIRHLVDRISNHKVVFNESATCSEFFYGVVNPVENGEQFSWLVTQKSNVMSPSGDGATRCEVTLNWFFELLRNAFNCYWWLEKMNDGRYLMRIEHVEYFRRGGQYSGTRPYQVDLTEVKPLRNFLRDGQAAKRLSDQTNRYSFNLQGMVQRYTFSWQGEGGSDEFKGWPMLFKAGWIEDGTSEDHQVDNIFADLNWLTLNSGTSTESSNNRDGLFIFAGYQAFDGQWAENAAPVAQELVLAEGSRIWIDMTLVVTAPVGQTMTLVACANSICQSVATYSGTGEMQTLHITYSATGGTDNVVKVNFGANYGDVIIHRVHSNTGNRYKVPNTESFLNPGIVLQNGPLAWPSLQNQYLHYDVPAVRWAFDSDDYDAADFSNVNGTVKLVKRQTVGVVPFREGDPVANRGVKTGLGVGVIETATVNLGSRNVEFELVMEIDSSVSEY